MGLIFSTVLVNQASYQNMILKYYNEHDDHVNIAGALTRCTQRGGLLVMPKNKNLNAAVDGLLRYTKKSDIRHPYLRSFHTGLFDLMRRNYHM